MPERRTEKRRPKRLRVKYGKDMPERYALTEDISRDGLFIKTASTLLPGKRVYVEIASEDSKAILLECSVMWIKKVPPSLIHVAKKGGMGLKITKFPAGEDLYMDLCKVLNPLPETDDAAETDDSTG